MLKCIVVRMERARDLEKGRQIHKHAIASGVACNIYVASSLIRMYAKCGSLEDAQNVFEKILQRNLVLWNALILGYAENCKGEVALELFASIPAADSRSFVAALKACTNIAVKEEGRRIDGKLVKIVTLQKGQAIHSEAVSIGFDTDMFVESTLVEMYAKCGSMTEAREVFDKTMIHDRVSWTSLMVGYADNGEEELALQALERMLGERSCSPDARTFLVAVKACTALAAKEPGKDVDGKLVKLVALEKGMQIHAQVEKFGCDIDMFLASSLVDMYSKCGSLLDARTVFDKMLRHDVVSWTSLLLGYAENGEGELALDLFIQMQNQGCRPDAFTYIAALNACSNLAIKEEGRQVSENPLKTLALEKGRAIHREAAERGYEYDMFLASSLVEMYVRCGNLTEAQLVLNKTSCRNSVASWTTLMLGYIDAGQGEMALELLSSMKREGRCIPDAGTFVAALKACGNVVAVEEGKAVHLEICKAGVESDGLVANSLVDFYGKCGCMPSSQQVFDSVPATDSVTWTSLIAGYSRQGDSDRVFKLLQDMEDQGLRADGITFLCILTACSHSGLVDKGREFFRLMSFKRFGLRPGIEHYICMIDILGRANQLDEATKMVESMPFPADALTWRTLLSACGKWKNAVVGRLAYESLVKMGFKDSTTYTLMANIYASQNSAKQQ